MLDIIGAAHAMGGQPGGEAGGNPILGMLPFIMMFAVLYFLISRPQIKKQKAQQKMVDELKKGDDIVTSGGIHGTILNLKEDVIVVRIADGVKIDVSRSAVSRVKGGEEEEKK